MHVWLCAPVHTSIHTHTHTHTHTPIYLSHKSQELSQFNWLQHQIPKILLQCLITFYVYHPIKNQRDMKTEEYILDTQRHTFIICLVLAVNFSSSPQMLGCCNWIVKSNLFVFLNPQYIRYRCDGHRFIYILTVQNLQTIFHSSSKL